MKHLLKHKKLLIFLSILLVLVIFLAVKIHSVMRLRSYAYVQPYSDLKNIDYSAASDGVVTNENAQSITLDSEKTVSQVYVKAGDTVKKGDKLFSYDTSDLKNQLNAQNEVIASSTAQLDIKNKLLDYYNGLKTAKPGAASDETGSPDKISDDQKEENGTSDNNGDDQKEENDISDNSGDDQKGESDISGDDAENGNSNDSDQGTGDNSNDSDQGTSDDSKAGDSANTVNSNENSGTSDTAVSSGVTDEEKADLIKSTTSDITSLKQSINTARVEVQSLEQQIDDCTVKALVDGKIASVADPKTSVSSGNPFITISSDTGIAIKGYVDEFLKSQVKPDSKISVTNYLNDSTSKGTITYVSDFPSASDDIPASTINNVSYYEFTAFLKDGSGFNPDDSVSITLDSGKQPGIISRGYVKSDKKGTYCLVDRKGRLKKVYVKTSMNKNDSESVIILSGLKDSDLIAFPYSKTGYVGNKTSRKAQETLLSKLLN